jgi:hypothetical protein
MPATVSLPPAYRRALGEFSALEDGAANALTEAVGQVPAYSPVSAIEASARAALEPWGASGRVALVPVLLALRGQLREQSPSQIAHLLADSADLDLDGEARTRLEQRCEALLSTPAINTTSVAVDLQTQHDQNFQSARIFTDVRHVFEDVEQKPTGAVIVQMLQIQTWDRSGGSDALVIAMDERDLLSLKAVVERALKKTETLRRTIADQGIHHFELEDAG